MSFTLDGWRSPYGKKFLAVTGHWYDSDWQLQDVLLGFEHLEGSQTGDALKDAFVQVVKRYGLERKILAITSDNGSNVLKMAKALETHTRNDPDTW